MHNRARALQQHVRFLASDAMLGRATPSPELDSAAAFAIRNLSYVVAAEAIVLPQSLTDMRPLAVCTPMADSIRMRFIESPVFTASLRRHLDDEQ